MGADMTTRLAKIALPMLCLVSCAYPLMAQSVCRPADALSARTITDLQALVMSTDSVDKASRDSLKVAATTPNNVKLVTTSSTCQSALTAFNTKEQTPGTSRLISVYQIGKLYGVEDPTLTGGEYRAIRIFNSKWQYQSTMAVF
jgi:hypothetical protein